jgi:hypothetical protein
VDVIEADGRVVPEPGDRGVAHHRDVDIEGRRRPAESVGDRPAETVEGEGRDLRLSLSLDQKLTPVLVPVGGATLEQGSRRVIGELEQGLRQLG